MTFVLFAAMLLALAGAGTLALDRRDPLALRMTLGLAMWGHALFFLALCGQLRPWPIVALAAVALAGLRPERPHPILLAALPLAALALHPPLAFDETLYHLPFVRAVAESGRLQFFADMRFPAFPWLQELLCVPLFLFAGDSATHLVSLVEVMLTAALLADWGRRHDRRAGALAAAFFLGSPIVIHLAVTGYVDAALTLFVTAGAYCLDQARPLLAGFFLGTSTAVKYLGGFFAAAGLRRRTAIPLILAALHTTAWLFVTTGNPLFPFFGSSAWALPLPHVPWTTRLLRTLLLPWNVTFARDQVNQQPPFTPLFAAALLIVAVAAVRDRRARFVAAITIAYIAAFSFLPQDSRYLVPLLPLLGVTAAVAVAKRWPRATTILAIVAIAPGIAYTAHRLHREGLPPRTPAQREAALARRIPEYATLRRADGPVYVCGAEQLKYHAPHGLAGDHAGPNAFARVLTGDVAANLQSIGMQYLLISKRACTPSPPTAGMQLVFEDAHAQLWRVQSSPSRR